MVKYKVGDILLSKEKVLYTVLHYEQFTRWYNIKNHSDGITYISLLQSDKYSKLDENCPAVKLLFNRSKQ